MVNEGDKEKTESQGNDDTASITTAKCKAGKRFQVNKLTWSSLSIILKKIGFF